MYLIKPQGPQPFAVAVTGPFEAGDLLPGSYAPAGGSDDAGGSNLVSGDDDGAFGATGNDGGQEGLDEAGEAAVLAASLATLLFVAIAGVLVKPGLSCDE